MRGIVLFALGVPCGFLLFSYIALPVLYSVPKALYQIAQGRVRRSMFLYYLFVFCFWNLVLITFGAVLLTFAPDLTQGLLRSELFTFGTMIGMVLSLVYTLTSAGRNDLNVDFWELARGKDWYLE